MTDARIVVGASGLLADFNAAGVLAPADVHVAVRLGAIAGEAGEAVLLAVALAVRAPRLGHVFVDLATAADTTTVESDEAVDVSALPWPQPRAWVAAVAASPLVALPLHLDNTRLYLDRYWREELALAADLAALAADAADVDLDALAAGIAREFPPGASDDRQALAAAAAVLRRFSVIAGGPGTGKTTTVARVVALLRDQAPDALIALAAPTGKAAARLEEATAGLSASTLHRLLGWRPDSDSRFRYNRANRLPHDVVIVDETSMVGLSLMARLVEAVRPEARLVLVGDPDQLTSIEAGAVLGDVVGPARERLTMRPAARELLERVTARSVDVAAGDGAIGDGIVVLERGHRFSGPIAELAAAISAGDGDAALAALASEAGGVTWIAQDAAAADASVLAPIRERAVATARAVTAAAIAGDAPRALAALGAFRLLCAHRRGPHGASTWMRAIERWLAVELDDFDPSADWYVGRPLLVTENDYSLNLYNGDTGVVVSAGAERIVAAFERHGSTVAFSPTRLGAVDTIYAMTIHKSQGSQFATAAVLLPPPESPILTRELLYTAVTRASDHVIVAGAEATIRAAISRPAARASALRERLWDR